MKEGRDGRRKRETDEGREEWMKEGRDRRREGRREGGMNERREGGTRCEIGWRGRRSGTIYHLVWRSFF